MNEAKRAQYARDGFVTDIPVFSEAEAERWGQHLLSVVAEETRRRGGRWDDRDHLPWEASEHPLKEMYRTLVTHPRLVAAVTSVLGPDVLVRNGDVFFKDPGLHSDLEWHIDTHARDGSEDGMVTAWLGLGIGPADRWSGGMRFAVGLHRVDFPDHPSDRHDLSLGPAAMEIVKAAPQIQSRMRPGMASLHHMRTPHVSGTNYTPAPRIGFVVRYMAPWCTREAAGAGIAMRVAGHTDGGSFHLSDDFPTTWQGVPPTRTTEEFRWRMWRAIGAVARAAGF